MARIRSVKPEFWDDRKLAKRASRDARLLYIALWNLADEHGRLNGDPQWIKGQAFSYDDDLDATAVAKLLDELAAVDAVMTYEVDGDPYLYLPKLAKHQRLEPEKVKSRLPDPPVPGVVPEPPPDTPPSESGAGESAPRTGKPARDTDEAARGADEPASDANKPALLYVAGSREQGAGSRGPRGARGASILGTSLLEEHTRQVSPSPPRDVTRRTGEQIDRLLDDPEVTADEIRAGLALLRAKPNLGPGTLPNLVNQVRQETAHPELSSRASPRRGNFRGGAADPLTDQKYGPGSTVI